MMAAGVTCPATTSWPTPARKAPVSNTAAETHPRETRLLTWLLWSVICPYTSQSRMFFFMSFTSFLWSTTKGPKRLPVWKGSAEIRDRCSCAVLLCQRLPAETEAYDQVSVWRQVGKTPNPVHPR